MESNILRTEVEPLLSALGKVIRERRVSLGMSQEELAEKSGLHRTYVSDVERGIRNLTVGALWFLSNGLGMQLPEIISLMEDRAAVHRSASAVNDDCCEQPKSEKVAYQALAETSSV